ncbi:MAG: amino acid adenylation domain-containing protein [Clostridia bacterium]|nr:amino acid adenylation domain-containing protein [Clostridia bacterium]
MTKSILDWLETCVLECPDKEAFGDPNKDISFAELSAKAKAGGSLIAASAQARQPVLICVEKSVEAVICMFSAAYADCPYSFLEANQPKARIEKILQTLEPAVVIADEEGMESFKDIEGLPVVHALKDVLEAEICEETLKTRRMQALDTDPLYINFTSGSTGVPKGVAICHRSVIDFIPVFDETFGIGRSDVIANQAPFDFDVSVKDIYSGLYTGAKVQLIPRSYFSVPVNLMDYLTDKKVTTCIWAVSAMCFVSVMNGFEYKVPETINKICFSGEVMPVKHLNKWKKYLPQAMFANVYGPTEITCNCTYYIIDRDFEKGDIIPAGKAFPNEKVFLLDEEDKLITNADEEGEICVAGTCLALGYYNNPEKTAEAFVQNPLNKAWPELIYRTGDLAKYDENGDLIYTSRKDFQVKHMGHRIEMGEIENAAMDLETISRACCIYEHKRSKILLFCTGSCTKETLEEHLTKVLPQFMHPNTTIFVDSMPMTKNGKIDRNALMAVYEERKGAR